MNRRPNHLLAVLWLVAAAASAAPADVSGSWDVDGSVYANPVKFSCTLKQDGARLSGTARIEERDVPLTGTVQDKTVTWKFDVEHEGTQYTLEFTGTLDADGIQGTIAVAGVSGEFTAKRR